MAGVINADVSYYKRGRSAGAAGAGAFGVQTKAVRLSSVASRDYYAAFLVLRLFVVLISKSENDISQATKRPSSPMLRRGNLLHQ